MIQYFKMKKKSCPFIRVTAILFLILIYPAIIHTGCEKDNPPEVPDYRDPYTGKFSLTTIEKVISMCYDPSPTCIDGWEVLFCDTIYKTSEITRHDSCKIEIPFGEGNLGYYNDTPILRTIYPEINVNGELDGQHDLFNVETRTRNFQGNFKGHDTLYVYFEFSSGGMGSYMKFEITGIREN